MVRNTSRRGTRITYSECPIATCFLEGGTDDSLTALVIHPGLPNRHAFGSPTYLLLTLLQIAKASRGPHGSPQKVTMHVDLSFCHSALMSACRECKAKDTSRNRRQNHKRSAILLQTLLLGCWRGSMKNWLIGPTTIPGKMMKVCNSGLERFKT